MYRRPLPSEKKSRERAISSLLPVSLAPQGRFGESPGHEVGKRVWSAFISFPIFFLSGRGCCIRTDWVFPKTLICPQPREFVILIHLFNLITFFYLKCQVTLSQLGTKLGLVSKAVSKKLKEKYREEKKKKEKKKPKSLLSLPFSQYKSFKQFYCYHFSSSFLGQITRNELHIVIG